MVVVKQLYTGCLAEAAYYVESDGEAAIIDPLRDIEPYLQLAKERGAKIRYVLETHFHADFVSGHLELARATGATIVYGPGANPQFDAHIAKDKERLPLGKTFIEVWHTPGHTPESVCYLLYDEDGKPYAIFTGDTLFVGEVGRPDLAVKSDLTQEDLAGMLFDSLQKLKTLPDDVLVYPAHGPGSQCGKNIGEETFSTIGKEKRTNYAMLIEDKETFIKTLTENMPPPPKYFFMDAVINKTGYAALDEVIERSYKPLSPEDVETLLAKEDVVILDTRPWEEFEKGHIPKAINIGLDGSFAVWVGAVLNPEQKIIVVAPEGRERESIVRMARVGFENVLGYLQGGFDAWKQAGKPIETLPAINPEEIPQWIEKGYKVLDVRRITEVMQKRLPESINISLETLQDRIAELDPSQGYIVHCAAGYRSVIATCLLRRAGFKNVYNIRGGMEAIEQCGVVSVVSA